MRSSIRTLVSLMRSRLIAVGSVAMTLIAAQPAFAQECTGKLCGSAVPDATPVVDWVNYTMRICKPGGCNFGGTAGTFAEACINMAGGHDGDIWTLDMLQGQSNGFFKSPETFAGICTVCAGGLSVSCPGRWNVQLYSNKGNFSGNVISLPSGQPLPSATIFATRGSCGQGPAYSIVTDTAGTYNFARGQPAPAPGNNWGVPLDSPGGVAGGPVTNSFVLSCGPCSDGRPSATTSATNVTVNLTCRESFMEEGPIRSPNTCSPGKPVSATTGNVYFDQTDATIPGVAAHGLSFVRGYNSANAQPGRYGMFGPGWSHTYEGSITQPASGVLLLRAADGVAAYFSFARDEAGDAVFSGSVPFTTESEIRRKPDGTFERRFRKGGLERYASLTDPVVGRRGRLTAIVDPSGNTTSLVYDTQGRLASVTDIGGRALTFQYSGSTIVLSGPAGPIATYSLDTGSPPVLTSAVYADGDGDGLSDGSFAFTYATVASRRRLITIADGTGRVVETHDYDPATGRGVTSAVSGNVEKLTLNFSQPLKTLVTDTLGRVTTYEYASIWGQKLVTKITGPCSGCGGGSEIQEWTYDDKGRVASYRDGEGDLTTYTYDQATGDLLAESRDADPSGTGSQPHVTSFTYYSSGPGTGRIHTRTEPNGATTTYDYVAAGPSTITQQVTATTNRVTGIEYTPTGKPQFITDPRNNRWELSHSTLGDLEWIKDPTPAHNQTSYVHDAMGRLQQVGRPTVTGDPLIEEPLTTYDVLGRVRRVVNPDTTYTEVSYDLGGRRTRVRDPLNRLTDFVYDSYGRLDTVRDAKLGETHYGYDDVASNLVSLTDARGKTTRFEYDPANRVRKVCSHPGLPCTRFDEFTYDRAGRVKTRTDRRGVITTYAYDGLGRLTGKTYSDATPAVTFGYDEGPATYKGRLTSASNGPYTLAWTYDLAAEILSETRGQTSVPTHTVSSTYDLAGNRASLSLDAQLLATYTFDERNLPATIVRAATPNRTYIFGHDAASRRKTLSFPNGVTTTYGYDNRSRLASIGAAAGPNVVTNFTYPDHDPLGNRLSRGGSTAPAEGYGYDELYRLLTVTRGPQASEGYTYDGVGNRLTSQTVPVWSYDDWNELTSNSGADFQYDPNGNVTEKTEAHITWTYQWDAENRLTSTRRNGVLKATYGYDALGRRALRTVAGGTGAHVYVYDGDDILRIGAGGAGDALKELYVHGPGIDEPLESVNASGAVSHFHADGLGSIVRTTNSQAAVTLSRQYDAFGNPELGGTTEGYAYTGREWDAETGLYYYRARYYDPKIGRFISEDPIGFWAGINFYSYVMNSPTNLRDPFGLDALTADPNIRKCMCELWKASGYGVLPTERAAWATMTSEGAYSCVRWPWTATNKKETWKGPIPEGSQGILHTHPTRLPSTQGSAASPRPSSGDENTAKKIGMPVYVVSDDGVWKYDPSTKKTTKECGSPREWCEK